MVDPDDRVIVVLHGCRRTDGLAGIISPPPLGVTDEINPMRGAMAVTDSTLMIESMVTLKEKRNTHVVHPLDAPFIDQQRQRLTELRQTLLNAARNATDEGIGVNAASAGGAREYEEDAQNLTMLQSEEELVARTEERLTRVERALAKIAEGTYGYSDLSAQPIPRERLVSVPEAACTLEEEQAIAPE